jgi:chemotaxis signal transduction protein
VQHTSTNPNPTAARACAFELGGQVFAVEGTFSRQFVRIEQLTPVPHGPQSLAGLFSVRGQVRALIDLRRAFGLASATTRQELAALLECQGNTFAVAVDRIVGFSLIDPGSFRPIPPEAPHALRVHAKGTIRLEGREAVLLDLERILDQIRAETKAA